jgi:hypothetical protein
MAAADIGQWMWMLAFNGRGMLTASGAVTTVGDEDVNIKWGGRNVESVTCLACFMFDYQTV